MYILILFNFIFMCFIGVFLFIKLKEKEDDIEELYDLIYEQNQIKDYKKKQESKKQKGVILNYDNGYRF